MSRTDAGEVLVDWDGPVAIVRLNRAQRLNSLGATMVVELLDTLKEVGRDNDARAVVLTGQGRGFCSGMDLAEGIDGPPSARGKVQRRHDMMSAVADLVATLRAIPQPVIAAMHGPAVGGGMALALAADVRIADDTATFTPAMTRIGFSGGDMGLSWWLPRLVGFSAAAEMLYTAEPIVAVDALSAGLVSRVVATGTDVIEAIDLGHRIATNAPFAIRETKRLLNAGIGMAGLLEHMQSEVRAQVLCSLTDDVTEGMRAAVERRAPTFTDR